MASESEDFVSLRDVWLAWRKIYDGKFQPLDTLISPLTDKTYTVKQLKSMYENVRKRTVGPNEDSDDDGDASKLHESSSVKHLEAVYETIRKRTSERASESDENDNIEFSKLRVQLDESEASIFLWLNSEDIDYVSNDWATDQGYKNWRYEADERSNEEESNEEPEGPEPVQSNDASGGPTAT